MMLRSVRHLVAALRAWWRRARRARAFAGTVTLDSGADPTPELQVGKLVLIGAADRPKWLRFACPCRCGEVLALNLMRSYAPCWSVEHHADGTLSVAPSVDATTCGSHFWIERNRVRWV